ncbi:tRNA 2-thiouridine(34) synthase MnmA [Conexibacter sp. SYSU D00693]|uniref:tRNA 2-thiouridine(34) synthase MnmA n=1 Tax=Conexibacter sp. SYSU D00693 TaxID=2812560 RepID=UPI00196A332A|nr:tRNA 2-thiouridine(34) synthase MnmA [Conexibacter sp. SYSU D00693]
MDERFAEHLEHPVARGHRPDGGHDGHAGGALCGDLVRVSVAVAGDTVVDAGFDAEGCGALTAAASAAVDLVRGEALLDAAHVGTQPIAAALGGLSAGKLHAAELVADALHAALGQAAWHDAQLAADPGRTLVAMSGGVDSTVAALLAGPGAATVTLELWRDPENDAEASCCSANAVRAARAVAHGLGLPHLTLDLREPFREGVVDPWLAGHAAGLTPNPCVGCNGRVRLDAMVQLADRLGAATLTTGHYARTTPDGLVRLAADPAKDQAYALAGLDPATTRRLRFPLGEHTKDQVRALAREHGLTVADKADSQDLCFLAGTGRARFLARHGGLDDRPGDVVDTGGAVLGRHRGAHLYTVGQRRGLGLDGTGTPLYVLHTDPAANTVTVGDRAQLATTRIALDGLRLHRPAAAVDRAKLRYKAEPVACRLEDDVLVLDAPTEAVAPGQVAVLLQGDAVVGHAAVSASRLHLDGVGSPTEASSAAA